MHCGGTRSYMSGIFAELLRNSSPQPHPIVWGISVATSLE